MLREVNRCDECKHLTIWDLAEVAVEESAGTVDTMGGRSRIYAKSILRICPVCIEDIYKGAGHAGWQDAGAVDQATGDVRSAEEARDEQA